MAWNQPGGNGDQDPWGSRGGRQGPPDIDEALKKLQSKVTNLFGEGGPPRSGGGAALGGKSPLLVLGVLFVAWILAGIYIVEQAERGVVLRFGKEHDTTGPGPHWAPYLIDRVEKVNVDLVRSAEIGFRTARGADSFMPHEALMLTEDENIIDIKFAVQYRVKDAGSFLFNVFEPEIVLRRATESAIREVVGKNDMDTVITSGRSAVASATETLIQKILDDYDTGLEATSVNMQSAQPPREVQAAFDDAVKAREDQVRVVNQAKAYSADLIPKAKGDAEAILERSEGYRQRVIEGAKGDTSRFLQVLSEYKKAPEVTRKRLYLDTIESVMDSTSKVLIDVEGGNNIMYLPLDKLVGQRSIVTDRGDGYSGTAGDVEDRPQPGRPIGRREREGRSRR